MTTNISNYSRIHHNVEGVPGHFNDIIIFQNNAQAARYNLIYFGGDIQDYPDEMSKSLTSRNFMSMNLINTGNLLLDKYSKDPSLYANIFIIRANYFHLKCFANYSNFVISTVFGVPANETDCSTHTRSYLDDTASATSETTTGKAAVPNGQSASASSSPSCSSPVDDARCWSHLQKLVHAVIVRHNSELSALESATQSSGPLDAKLPLIVCGFSKGCVVLNQMCAELPTLERLLDKASAKRGEWWRQASAATAEELDDEGHNKLEQFVKQVGHLIWLDGGHSGTTSSWITDDACVQLMRRFGFCCYVFVTPYQIKSHKTWSVDEYRQFLLLLDKWKVKHKHAYYFQEREEDEFDIQIHFDILSKYDASLLYFE